MEADSMACPRCKKPWMEVKGNRLICKCGYEEEIKVKMPSYGELLVENFELKQKNEKLIDDIIALHNALSNGKQRLEDIDQWYERFIAKHIGGK